MARVEITVAGLVPTPVAAVEVPGAPALNAKLQHLIPQRRDATSGLLAFSSGGRHSDRETVVWGGTPIAAVLDAAEGVATQLARSDRQAGASRLDGAGLANVNGRGDPAPSGQTPIPSPTTGPFIPTSWIFFLSGHTLQASKRANPHAIEETGRPDGHSGREFRLRSGNYRWWRKRVRHRP
jgi:hypothetical protein